MELTGPALWLAEIAAAWALLTLIQTPLHRGRHPVLAAIVFITKVLLIPGAALLFVAVVSPFSYRHGDLIAAAYLALCGDAAADAVSFVVRLFRRGERQARSSRRRLTAALSLLLCICLACYGFINAGRVREQTHAWTAAGLTEEHTFAFLADVHAGSAQSLSTLEQVCRQINAAAPEFVVLGGDITDEHTSREDMQAVYRVLSQLEAPIYFVYGNHDRQPDSAFCGGRTYSDAELAAALEKAGVTVLSDEFVQIADDLMLLGREDVSRQERRPWSQLTNPCPDKALVVADHQPYDEEQLADEVSALQLSGHTHAAQFQLGPWSPSRWMYKEWGGLYEEENQKLYVSTGLGGTLPFRFGAWPQFVVLTLHRK